MKWDGKETTDKHKDNEIFRSVVITVKRELCTVEEIRAVAA